MDREPYPQIKSSIDRPGWTQNNLHAYQFIWRGRKKILYADFERRERSRKK